MSINIITMAAVFVWDEDSEQWILRAKGDYRRVHCELSCGGAFDDFPLNHLAVAFGNANTDFFSAELRSVESWLTEVGCKH